MVIGITNLTKITKRAMSATTNRMATNLKAVAPQMMDSVID